MMTGKRKGVYRPYALADGYVDSEVLRPDGRHRESQHRVVAAHALGRALGPAVVHHVDDDRGDNIGSNLVILENQSEHMALHARRAVLRAGGDPFNDVLCWICGRLATKAEAAADSERGRRHLGCIRAYVRASAAKREQRYAAMPPIPCACGCGEMIPPITKRRVPAKFKHGHNGRIVGGA